MVTSLNTKIRGKTLAPKVGQIASDNWEPFLVDGVPTGRFHILENTKRPDNAVISGIWEHRVQDSPDGKFFFKQAVDEVFFVIEGNAVLTYPDGTTVHLAAGNSFYFPRGSEVTWQTTKTFIKFFIEY